LAVAVRRLDAKSNIHNTIKTSAFLHKLWISWFDRAFDDPDGQRAIMIRQLDESGLEHAINTWQNVEADRAS